MTTTLLIYKVDKCHYIAHFMFRLTMYVYDDDTQDFDSQHTYDHVHYMTAGSKRFRVNFPSFPEIHQTYTDDHAIFDVREGDAFLLKYRRFNAVEIFLSDSLDSPTTRSWFRENARNLLNNMRNAGNSRAQP